MSFSLSTAIVSWRSRFPRASMSPCLAPYTRRTLVVSAPLLLCSVLSCLSSAASFHLRLLSIPVLLSFAATCSRHFASTTLIESSLHARVITPPLLSPERSASMTNGSPCLTPYARRTLVVSARPCSVLVLRIYIKSQVFSSWPLSFRTLSSPSL